jgi:non-canonical (house-cleaning) NTP pyrophosphatase
MKFIVGSASHRKIVAVKKFVALTVEHDIEVAGYPSRSGVPDTPWDDEMLEGARNRANDAKVHMRGDYFVGLESGLVERYGSVYEETWSCVVDKHGNEYVGFSSGLRVPQGIVDEMVASGMTHGQVMRRLEIEHGLEDSDTWGSYTGRLIIREISLVEALRNSLVQAFAPDDSLYTLSQ